MKPITSLLSLVLLALVGCFRAEFSEISEYQKYFDKLRDMRYNVKIPPRGNGGYGLPIEVYSTMYIIDIYKVDIRSQDYEVVFYFRQRWNDTRLAYPDLDLIEPIILQDESVIWTPDLFFVREKSGIRHDLVKPNTFIRINPNGEVHYSNRFTMTFSCPMNFKTFPHDTQKCSFGTESFGFTMDRMTLFWENKTGSPVQYNSKIDVFPYKIITINSSEHVEGLNDKKYKNLAVDITFERSQSLFTTSLYIPSVALLLITWITFWMPEFRVLRLTLLLVCLYLMVQTGRDAKEYEPNVPYLTGIDIWVDACNIFVFFALLEFVFVNILKTKLANRMSHINPEDPVLIQTDKKSANPVPVGSAVSMFVSRLKGKQEIHQRMDKASQIFFPILFLAFCFVYFIIY